jgi:hypothetical protein
MAINQQATRAHGACTRHLFRIAGEKHDRNVARPRVAFQLAEQIPRARVPKRQFGHDDVRVQLARPSKGFGTVLGGGDVEAHRRERDGKQCERIVVAVYQQHERSHRWCVRATPIHGPDPPKSSETETIFAREAPGLSVFDRAGALRQPARGALFPRGQRRLSVTS